MLGDLKFCSMFVLLCLSVCFRNVGGAGMCRCSGPLRSRRAKKKRYTDDIIILLNFIFAGLCGYKINAVDQIQGDSLQYRAKKWG